LERAVASPEPARMDEAGHGAEARCATACGIALACGPEPRGRSSSRRCSRATPDSR